MADDTELPEFFVPLLQTKVYPLLDLQLNPHFALKTISLHRKILEVELTKEEL